MEVSKLRRLANWLVDIAFIFLLFCGAVRLLPINQVPVQYLRWLLFGIAFLYYTLSEILFQRTIGKLITRTAVVNLDDAPPSFQQVLVRSLCRFLPLEPISILFSDQALSWHDRISKTKVVSFGY